MRMKTFDCVEMMHRAGKRIGEKLEGMTLDEEAEYWQKRTAVLRKRQQTLRERREQEEAA